MSEVGGCDNVSPLFLKLCATSLVAPNTHLLFFCMTKCTFPKRTEGAWTRFLSNLSKVFKGWDVHCANNYNQISLLCILSNVLESMFFIKSLTLFALLFPACNMVSFKVNFVYLNFCMFTPRSSVHLTKAHIVTSFSSTARKCSTLFPIRNFYIHCGYLALLGLCGFGSKTILPINFTMSVSMVYFFHLSACVFRGATRQCTWSSFFLMYANDLLT